MTRTRFCDSSGVQALVAAHRHARDQGGELLLAGCTPAVRRVLALTGIDQLIPSFTSLRDALAHAPADRSDGHLKPAGGSSGIAQEATGTATGHATSGLDGEQ